MRNVFEQKMKVGASLTDTNIELGLVQSLFVVQDSMCEFFKNIGCDGLTMIPACNSFLVVTKTKIKFFDSLKWLDEFVVCSEISNKTRVRLNLTTEVLGKDNSVVCLCNQEMCAVDATARTLRMLNTTLVPDDLEVTKESELVFEKLNYNVHEKDLIKTHMVDITNLDFYKHTNNVEYVKLMMSTLDLEFVSNNKIEEFEIHYITESRFGNELKIYRIIESGRIYFEIKHEDNLIVKAVLKYNKR